MNLIIYKKLMNYVIFAIKVKRLYTIINYINVATAN